MFLLSSLLVHTIVNWNIELLPFTYIKLIRTLVYVWTLDLFRWCIG